VNDEFTATKQLGFIFRADNCIGCHSCDAACSEKNGLPAHVAWRTVGYVEGGVYPNHTRVNTSMACNHCDDPVCLTGCPTGAYVKYLDTGAVVVDSDICFGCRYCTWVCPYEAPAFNPETGSVSKCDMCVDRLAQHLQPACVDACLGHALEFGEIRQYEQDHPEALKQMVGFPDPCITKPNIRFQQSQSLPATMTRTDTEPIHYQSMTGPNGQGHTKLDRTFFQSVGTTLFAKGAGSKSAGHAEMPKKQPWSSLHSPETSLVVFTLLVQFVVGAFLSVWSLGLLIEDGLLMESLVGPSHAILAGITVLLATGLGISTAHLGKPWRCYRALNNLRYSWVSREILALGLFFGGLALYTVLTIAEFSGPWIHWSLGFAVGCLGLTSIFTMSKIYMIPARPFWNHPHTWISFYASALVLGSYFVAGLLGVLTPLPVLWLAAFTAIALTTQLVRHVSERVHVRDLTAPGITREGRGSKPFGPLTTHDQATIHVKGEADASLNRLFGTFGKFHRLQTKLSYLTMSLSGITLAAVLITKLFVSGPAWTAPVVGTLVPWTIALLFVIALCGELIGRSLFYLVVTPTTMPKALFAKNPGFEQLARNTGLAKDPMVGVLPH
jgi:DMSO reductase iron-sulfur subunit